MGNSLTGKVIHSFILIALNVFLLTSGLCACHSLSWSALPTPPQPLLSTASDSPPGPTSREPLQTLPQSGARAPLGPDSLRLVGSKVSLGMVPLNDPRRGLLTLLPGARYAGTPADSWNFGRCF